MRVNQALFYIYKNYKYVRLIRQLINDCRFYVFLLIKNKGIHLPDFNQADECLLLNDCLLSLLKIKLILIPDNSHAIINVINIEEVQAA